MTDTNAVIAVYDNHSAAEHAVKELQRSGFDMASVTNSSFVHLSFVSDCLRTAQGDEYESNRCPPIWWSGSTEV